MASATAVVTASSFTSAAVAIVSVASAASAAVDEFSVETFGEFLLGSLTDREDLACEVEGLAGHLVVEVNYGKRARLAPIYLFCRL